MTDTTTTNDLSLLNRGTLTFRAVVNETWANAHDGKDCAWVERYDVISGTLSGIKGSFQNHGGFIAALNHKRQYLIIILIVIIVIMEHLFI